MSLKHLLTRDDVRLTSALGPLAALGEANLVLAASALPVPMGCPKPHVEYVESL